MFNALKALIRRHRDVVLQRGDVFPTLKEVLRQLADIDFMPQLKRMGYTKICHPVPRR